MNVSRVGHLLEDIDYVGIIGQELFEHLMMRDEVAREAATAQEDWVSGVTRFDPVTMYRYLEDSVGSTVGYR